MKLLQLTALFWNYSLSSHILHVLPFHPSLTLSHSPLLSYSLLITPIPMKPPTPKPTHQITITTAHAHTLVHVQTYTNTITNTIKKTQTLPQSVPVSLLHFMQSLAHNAPQKNRDPHLRLYCE